MTEQGSKAHDSPNNLACPGPAFEALTFPATSTAENG